MNDFAGMEDLMQDFLIESSGLLSDMDTLLQELENTPDDSSIFNEIFRIFHTIKGGAGFLNATELVALCHLAEGLFDKLRNGEMMLDADLMDVVNAVMEQVRQMFGSLSENMQPAAAPSSLIDKLNLKLQGAASAPGVRTESPATPLRPSPRDATGPDWDELYQSLSGGASDAGQASEHSPEAYRQNLSNSPFRTLDRTGRRTTDIGRKKTGIPLRNKIDAEKDACIRVDADRLNQTLNLSSEMAGIKSNLEHLLDDLANKHPNSSVLDALNQSINQVDALATKMRNAVARTRMQPIGRMFSKYRALADDLSRHLNKKVEVVLAGEDTELDANIIDQINEPLVHLLRNAMIHGIEYTDQRIAVGKPKTGLLRLHARQEENRVIITVTDDGKGMGPEAIRARAIDQGLLDTESASRLSKEECMNLVFVPGFSSRSPATAHQGNSGGLNKAMTAVKNLGATLSLVSESGSGCEFTLTLPLKLGLLQVRQFLLNGKLLAIPASLVRGVFRMSQADLLQVSGQIIMQVHGEALTVLPLSRLIGWEEKKPPELGVQIRFGNNNLILAVDSDAGPSEAAFRSMDTLCPKGIAGTSLTNDGMLLLILDVRALLEDILAPPARKHSLGIS